MTVTSSTNIVNVQKLKSVRVLCCTLARETYHHWKIFAPKPEGICIEIRRDPLVAAIKKTENVRAKSVEYLTINRLKKKKIDDLPFIKRDGYRHEKEWRVIAKCQDQQEFYKLPIKLEWIATIRFNPWMTQDSADILRNEIGKTAPNLGAKLLASNLTNSPAWKKAGDQILRPAP